MARRLFSSTRRGSFGGVGMSGSQFTGLVSVATVVATRLEILGLNWTSSEYMESENREPNSIAG